jgi:hypothetical protein
MRTLKRKVRDTVCVFKRIKQVEETKSLLVVVEQAIIMYYIQIHSSIVYIIILVIVFVQDRSLVCR